MRRLTLALATAALIPVGIISCRDAAMGPQGADASSLAEVLLANSAAGKITICHAAGPATDPKFVQLSVSENAASAHLDERGTPRAGHEVDYLVTDRTPCPPPATPGQLQVCKVGLPGITAGTPFTFVVNGTQVVVAAGQCVMLPFRVGTRVDVNEIVPVGTNLVGVTLLPASAGTTSAVAGTASVVVGTDVATVTFTNQSLTSGSLVICSLAGPGLTLNTPFEFIVTGIQAPFILPARADPAHGCGPPITLAVGQRGVFESATANTVNTVVTSIDVSPVGNLVSQGATFVQVQIVGGQTTTVTFTIASTIPPPGFLVICSLAGAGLTIDTPFEFIVSGIQAPFILPARADPAHGCGPPITLPVGQRGVFESATANTVNTVVASIDVSPVGNLVSQGATFVQVQIVSGQTTTVTFTIASTIAP